MHIYFFPIGYTTTVFAVIAADTLHIQLTLCGFTLRYAITSLLRVLLPVSLTYLQPKDLL